MSEEALLRARVKVLEDQMEELTSTVRRIVRTLIGDDK